MIKSLVLENRSYRRYDEKRSVEMETLAELIDLARFCASGANMQPLKYWLSNTREMNNKIFNTLAWAGYLKDWDGPEEGERPSAYIVVLGDSSISRDFGIDPGIAIQTILLGASEKGMGGCIFGSVKRKLLAESLNIPERYEVLYVIALGYPVEKVVIEEMKEGNQKYWRDAEMVHHVPKRGLSELIISP